MYRRWWTASAAFPRKIARTLAGARYDLGVIEHSWCAPYLEQLSPVCARTVLDLHNVESVLHARCAEVESRATAPPTAFSKSRRRNWSAPGCRAFRWCSPPRRPTPISPAPSRPRPRVAVYPNALPPTPLPPAGDEEAIVFSGNMEYHPNLTAVRFFRREVWPRLRERWPNLVWRLVGKNPGAVQRYTAGDPRIEVAGPVEDAVCEIARSRVAVVPLLTGSGTRLKILEAWAAGLPVVSTTIGAEGLPVQHGETALLADGAEAFAEAVTRLLTCTDLRWKIGSAGRLLLEKEFTWETAWKKLDF